jgi:hypothetical protein
MLCIGRNEPQIQLRLNFSQCANPVFACKSAYGPYFSGRIKHFALQALLPGASDISLQYDYLARPNCGLRAGLAEIDAMSVALRRLE